MLFKKPMNLIFKKSDGTIISMVSSGIKADVLYQDYSLDFLNDLGEMTIDGSEIVNLQNHKVIDGVITEVPEIPLLPIVSNEELKDEIEDLKQIIDIMLGGIDDGI